jgi:imidazolonepropionase-like amidohydrolase
VEFKIVSRKTRGKGGRPLPPPIDEGLEPVKAALEKQIPLLVAARTEVQIEETLKGAKEYEVAVVLLDADGATVHADRLIEADVGVIVPKQIVQKKDDEFYHQADDLSRKGVAVAFQSDAEDAARALPLLGLHAVERGMSADSALAAFTTDAARMYKLDDRIGSLEPGHEGDLLIFSGHPFEAGSRIERVIISGKEVP